MTLPYRFFKDLDEINRRRDDPVFDADTGMDREALLAACLETARDETKSRARRKAEAVAFMLDNAQLEVSPCDLFCDRINCGGIADKIKDEWSVTFREKEGGELEATDNGSPCGAYDGNADYSHTCPDWVSILTLGVPGLIARLEAALKVCDENKREFFEASLIAYRALRRLLLRFSEAYGKKSTKIAKAVSEICASLAERAPANLAEALELIAVFYRTQHHVEGVVTRSLGRLDKLIFPYYEAGEEADEVLRYFLNRMNDRFFYANIPFTVGGTDIGDDVRYERLTLRILEIYASLRNPSPKIQIRVAPSTPRTIIKKACEMIADGCSSIVFCNDETVIESFIKNGHTREDAENYVMIGCYEPSTQGCEVSCTCAGNVILPKAVECAMNGGRDMLSGRLAGLECAADFADFDSFYAEVKRQAAYFARQSMRRIRAYEGHMAEVCPSPLFSGSMKCCIDSGKDAYAGGAKYNYSSVNVFGIATAADALMAVKKLVFEDNTVSLTELSRILASNWEGHEKLRLTAKNKCKKYGDGDREVDTLAADLMHSTVCVINGAKNNRGGFFRAGAFSIDTRFVYGKRCAASADGRLAYETVSKNMSPVDGTGRLGVTAMITSACAIDYTELSNGTVLDVVLHKTAVKGEGGLCAMQGLVETFLQKGGIAIQINTLDPDVLREAQALPEKHRNLQVRVCGWNAHFTKLKKEEQDEFIEWSEKR